MGPKLVPPKWTGHLRATTLSAANRARVPSCSGCFATARRLRVRALSLGLPRRRLDFPSTPSIFLCQRYQRLGLGGSGFFSLASGFDAGSSLGQPPDFSRVSTSGTGPASSTRGRVGGVLRHFTRLLLCGRDCCLWSATIAGVVTLLSACLEDSLTAVTSTPVSRSMRSTLEAPGAFIYLKPSLFSELMRTRICHTK